MRKKLMTGICALALVFAFGACGEKEDAVSGELTGTPAVEQEDATKDEEVVIDETEDTDKSSEVEDKEEKKEDEKKEDEENVTSGPLYFTEIEYTIEGTTFKMPHSCRELEALGWTRETDKMLAPGTISDYLVVKAPYAHGLYLTVANPGTEEISIKDGDVVGISISPVKEIKLQKEVVEIDFMGVNFRDSHDEMLAALGTDYIKKFDQGFGMYDYTYDLGNGATLRISVWEEDGGVVFACIENCDESKVIYY